MRIFRVLSQPPLGGRKHRRPFRSLRAILDGYLLRDRGALVAEDDRVRLIHARVVELAEVDPAAGLLVRIASQPVLDLQCRQALALEGVRKPASVAAASDPGGHM